MNEQSAMDLTDEELAKKVQNGERELFRHIIERYEQKMMRYAKKFLFEREEVQDLVQDVFIKAYTNLRSFDVERKFSSWLYRIAHNEFINALSKKGKEKVRLFDLDEYVPQLIARETADQGLDVKEMRVMIDAHLKELDPKYREPLILYFFEDLSYKEIGEVLKIPVATVGVRINRAKTMLKHSMNV